MSSKNMVRAIKIATMGRRKEPRWAKRKRDEEARLENSRALASIRTPNPGAKP